MVGVRFYNITKRLIWMDYCCPVCKSNLRWQSLSDLKVIKPKTKCLKCGSDFIFNQHINEIETKKTFFLLWFLLTASMIIEFFTEWDTTSTILDLLLLMALFITLIYDIILWRQIPKDWPRWRMVQDSSNNSNDISGGVNH